MTPNETRAPLLNDLLLVAFLVALDTVTRVVPHDWNLIPVAATALFAGRVLRNGALAPIVPIMGLLIGDLFLGREDWRIALVVYAAFTLPAVVGMLSRKLSGATVVAASMVGCSLIFFVTTNFAVWAFSPLYPHTMQGLIDCYVAALPFLRNTVAGDLLWIGVLYAGLWLARRAPALAGRSI